MNVRDAVWPATCGSPGRTCWAIKRACTGTWGQGTGRMRVGCVAEKHAVRTQRGPECECTAMHHVYGTNLRLTTAVAGARGDRRQPDAACLRRLLLWRHAVGALLRAAALRKLHRIPGGAVLQSFVSTCWSVRCSRWIEHRPGEQVGVCSSAGRAKHPAFQGARRKRAGVPWVCLCRLGERNTHNPAAH